MSDDEREVDIDSDDDSRGDRKASKGFLDKRAHHNALERKRRDHIKESFSSLRDSIPTIKGDKSSRAQILKTASEYINFMRKKQNSHSKDIDDLRRQNDHIEAQIRALEEAKRQGQFSSAQEVLESKGLNFEVAAPVADAESRPPPAAGAEAASNVGTAYTYAEQGVHGSENGSSTSNVTVGGITVVQTGVTGNQRTTTVTVQPAGHQHQQPRTIQPGQSLLIMSTGNGGEPSKKKFKP